jgi:hypothetical protein
MWLNGDFSTYNDAFSPDYIGHVAAGDRDGDGLERRIVVFREHYSHPSILCLEPEPMPY